MVGKATTDTLTNKTLTSPTLTSPTVSSGSLTIATGAAIVLSTAPASISFPFSGGAAVGVDISGNTLRLNAGAASGGVQVTSGPLALGDAAARIVGGATSLSLRNNANNADNVAVTDAGAATIRAGLTVSAGGAQIVGGTSVGTSAPTPPASGLLVAGATPAISGATLGLGNTNPALGGGAAATLGTIGGSGPTAAGQQNWWQITIQGATRFVPLWG